MVKVVSEHVWTGSNCLPYEQELIGLGRYAVAQDIVVGFVFVYVAKAGAQHVDERIPPLHRLHESEQHDVP